MRDASATITIPIALAFLMISVSVFFISDVENNETLSDFEENFHMFMSLNQNSDYVDFTYETNSKGEVEITGYVGLDNHILIPETIEGNPVKRIGENAFAGNEEIVSVIISENVFHIKDSAFKNCKSLRNVIFGQGVDRIGNDAFKGCTSLKYMQFKGDAPYVGNSWKMNTPSDLIIYYVEGKTFNESSWKNPTPIPLSSPVPPTLFTATPDTSRIDLSWQIPDGVDMETILGYEVRYKKSEDNEWIKLFIKNKLTAELKNLSNGMEYEVCVCSVNIAGPGEPSNILKVIPFTVPEAPVLNITEDDYGIVLTWSIPNDMGLNITEYSVYQGDEKITPQNFTETEYMVAGLEKGILYCFSVTALNSAGEGLRSNIVEIILKEAHSISFEAGDDVSIDFLMVKEGDEIPHPSVPQREGYLFAGWVPGIPDYMPAHDVVVHAVWHTVISIPYLVNNLYYTGECQIGVHAGEGYDISGDYSMIDAGDYIAYLTLNEEFVWEDETYEVKEMLWKINPKIVYVFPEKNQHKFYFDEDSELKFVLSEDVDILGNLERVIGEDPDDYEIIIGSLSIDSDNYRLEMNQEIVYFTIVAVCPGVPTDLEAISDDEYLRIQWCAPEFDGGCEISCYEVWVKTGDDGVWILHEVIENQTSCNVMPEYDTTYEFAIKAVNSVGVSELSETAFIKTSSVEEDENKPDEYYKMDNLTLIALLISAVVFCLMLIFWTRSR